MRQVVSHDQLNRLWWGSSFSLVNLTDDGVIVLTDNLHFYDPVTNRGLIATLVENDHPEHGKVFTFAYVSRDELIARLKETGYTYVIRQPTDKEDPAYTDAEWTDGPPIGTDSGSDRHDGCGVGVVDEVSVERTH